MISLDTGGVTISFDPTVLRPIGVMSKLDGAFFQSKIDGGEIRFAFVSVVDLAIHNERGIYSEQSGMLGGDRQIADKQTGKAVMDLAIQNERGIYSEQSGMLEGDRQIADKQTGKAVMDLAIQNERGIHDEQFGTLRGDRQIPDCLAVLEFKPLGDLEGLTTALRLDHAQISESLSMRLIDGAIEFLPSKTALLQNYPNPFNPETWIPFKLSDDAVVRVAIYDASGQLVKEIDLGARRAGVYVGKDRAAYWDGRNAVGEKVGSGVYFYHLNVGDFSAVRKMLSLK